MIKLIILAGSVALAIWYAAVGGRQIDEVHVGKLYSEYMSAFDRGDADAVCSTFDGAVTGGFKSPVRSRLVHANFDKATACSSVENFYRAKKELEDTTGQEMFVNLEYTIKSITIAEDKQSATAEVLLEHRIGTEAQVFLDMRSEQTDTIVRRFGRAKFVRSDGVVNFFR